MPAAKAPVTEAHTHQRRHSGSVGPHSDGISLMRYRGRIATHPAMEGESERRPGARRPWALTAPAFEGLLGALDADRDRAAEEYERLRTRLIGLLRWWGASQPEDLADETLDRVARKIQDGVDISAG